MGFTFKMEKEESYCIYYAVDHPCIDCFRAVLYNGNVEATTVQTSNGETPLHRSTYQNDSLATLWEFLSYNRECVNIQGIDDQTALHYLEV
jgi:ankyrin repeat protein